MKKLAVNMEYVRRHLFTVAVTLALAVWFAYDGFVVYPATPAAELYVAIENSDPPATFDLDAFKAQKIRTQISFSALSLLAFLVVGLRLLSSVKFDLSYDEEGFVLKGSHYSYADISSVDRARWSAKGVALLKLKDGNKIILDSWHHRGVDEFLKSLPESLNQEGV